VTHRTTFYLHLSRGNELNKLTLSKRKKKRKKEGVQKETGSMAGINEM
jgi:hypothetical protein